MNQLDSSFLVCMLVVQRHQQGNSILLLCKQLEQKPLQSNSFLQDTESESLNLDSSILRGMVQLN